MAPIIGSVVSTGIVSMFPNGKKFATVVATFSGSSASQMENA
jgi:hypothetical protein